MSVEDRPAAVLPEHEAEKLRMNIESAINFALEAGWNAEQGRNEVEYVIEVFED